MKDLFINDSSTIYLNSGTESKTIKSTLEEIYSNNKNYEINPTYYFVDAYQKLWHTQKEIAHFFNDNPKNYFLRTNVTEVFNQFILGYDLNDNDEILTTNLEYQAIVNVLKYKTMQSKATLREFDFPTRDSISTDEILTLIKKEIGPKTKMLVISHVFTGSGLVAPICQIAEITNSKGIILVVDGAHSCGALKVDFENFKNVDFFAGNFHKWMMGPKGTAFGRVHPKHHEKLKPLMAGWTTFETDSPFDTFGEGHRFATKMMPLGTQNFNQYLGIKSTINFWKAHGENSIRKKLNELTQFAYDIIIENTKLKSLFPKEKSLQGPLITFVLPMRSENEGYNLMKRIFLENKLQIASTKIKGVWHLRVSPHIYNDQEEIVHASKILAKI